MERALCPILVGREAELSALEDALLDANRGDGQMVVLAGDAGMGKTRIAVELQRRARRLGMEVLWGACSEAELALPYLPFLNAIGNYLAGTDLEVLRTRLGLVRRELAHLFPQLEPEGVTPDSDSTQGRLRLYEAVLALLNLIAREQGLLLVIEDLHWADASTRELLDYLARRLRSDRILLLATHRSDEMHRRHPLLPTIQGWRRNATATIVDLEPLTPAKVAEMVIAIFDLGAEGVQDDTREFLHERTEGNPFVLEEMLKAALDRGDIFRNDDGWTRKALQDFRLPDSVRDTILLRLDRFSTEEVDILRAAAVLGINFSYEVLVAVAGSPEAEVRAAVEAFVLQQLLADDPYRAGARYRFRHALTKEAVYDDTITPLRQRLHGLAADTLRAAGGTPLEVSQHLLAAGRSEEALPLCLEAAERAEREYAQSDAAELYERVLPFLTDERERASVLCRLGSALDRAGRPASGHGYLAAGIEILDRLGEAHDAAHFRLILGGCLWSMGRMPDSLAEFEQARAVLEPGGPSADLAFAHIQLARHCLFQLDDGGCVVLAERAITIAEAAGADDVLVQARLYLGSGMVSSGNLEEGLELLDATLVEAIDRGLYSFATTAFNNVSVGGETFYRAAQVLDGLHQLDRVPDSIFKTTALCSAEGWAATDLGLLDRGAKAFETLQRVSRAAGSAAWEIRGRYGRAECYYGLGRVAEGDAIVPTRTEVAGVGVHDLINFDVIQIRRALEGGDVDAAATSARHIFDEGGRLDPHLRSERASWSAWAFIDAGEPALAEQAAEIGLGDRVGVLTANRASLESVLSLVRGDVEGAIRVLRPGVQFLDDAGYHFTACPIRRRLAELWLRKGDRDEAQAELQRVFDVASRIGLVIERKLAGEALRKLGVDVDEGVQAPAVSGHKAGERYVTVLFVDVRGYAAMAQEKSPAELADTIAALQRWARAEIEKQQGVLDKFAGDAVMATFNISGSHVDHAQHALACAIAIRDKAAAMGLPVGSGIATGPAVVGALTEGANLSVIGETTNLASRLQGQAAGGEVLLTAETHRRVKDWLARRNLAASLDSLRLKGFEMPVEAWRVGSAAAS